MSGCLDQLFEQGRSLTFGAGQHLFRVGDAVAGVHLVMSGQVALQRVTEAGATLTLQRAGLGDVLAEASVYAPHYHCDGVVLEKACLRVVALTVFRRALANDVVMSEHWARRLAEATQEARMRAEVRSLRTVASRLNAWLSLTGGLPTKGKWQDVATELGVSREALYRELARRR